MSFDRRNPDVPDGYVKVSYPAITDGSWILWDSNGWVPRWMSSTINQGVTFTRKMAKDRGLAHYCPATNQPQASAFFGDVNPDDERCQIGGCESEPRWSAAGIGFLCDAHGRCTVSTNGPQPLSPGEHSVSLDEFKKADNGKPRPDLTPTALLIEMGHVMAHGAEKYGADNWQKCEDPRRYEAAAMRHLLAFLSGEEIDPDSGRNHLAHCACSLAMRFGLERGQG